MADPRDTATSDDLDATIEEYRRALHVFANGDPNPIKSLFSRRDDVTLANPHGLARRGWAEVEQGLELGASRLRDGSPVEFEQVSKYVTAEVAYMFAVERFPGLKVGGREETITVTLRVTTIFRREDDGWKVVHRHADPLVGPQPPDILIRNAEI